MLKNIYLVSLLLFLSITINAQKKLNNSDAQKIREQIIKKSTSTNTIASDFVQFKHLSFLDKDIESSGKLFFKEPNLIKWQYEIPFKYSVVFKNDKLFINDDGTKSDIDLSSNKAFKSLNSLIVKSVKGDMFDEEKFDVTYFKDKRDNYLITFTSKEASLKSFIGKFELIFHKNNLDVLQIKMIESSEDYTKIVFKNQKNNEAISDSVFNN